MDTTIDSAADMADIVVTADHVYLPLDELGNVGPGWAVTDVSTTRVSRGTCLRVPADLALFLSRRRQVQVLGQAPQDAQGKSP
jgi:hypothetical protein